jgi:hypothetical protein
MGHRMTFCLPRRESIGWQATCRSRTRAAASAYGPRGVSYDDEDLANVGRCVHRPRLLRTKTAAMNHSRHLAPAEAFPWDLSTVGDRELLTLYGRAVRQMEREIVQFGQLAHETEFRVEELRLEIQQRDNRDALRASRGRPG